MDHLCLGLKMYVKYTCLANCKSVRYSLLLNRDGHQHYEVCMHNGHTAVQFQAVSLKWSFIMDLYDYGFSLDLCLKVFKTDFKSGL